MISSTRASRVGASSNVGVILHNVFTASGALFAIGACPGSAHHFLYAWIALVPHELAFPPSK